jgi:hypothetical protein
VQERESLNHFGKDKSIEIGITRGGYTILINEKAFPIARKRFGKLLIRSVNYFA